MLRLSPRRRMAGDGGRPGRCGRPPVAAARVARGVRALHDALGYFQERKARPCSLQANADNPEAKSNAQGSRRHRHPPRSRRRGRGRPGERPGAVRRPRRRGLAPPRGIRHLERRLPGIRAHRRRREHVGAARRVPLRLAPDEGRLHPPGPRGARGQGRRSAPQARVDRAVDARRRLPLRGRGDPRRRPHLAPAPTDQGGGHGGGRVRDHRGRRGSARTKGRHLHALRRALRRSLHDEPGDRSRTGGRGLRRPLPLLAQPGRPREGGLPGRQDHPARPRGLHALPGLHRKRPRAAGRGDGPPAGRPRLEPALRGPQLDAGRPGARLQHERAVRRPGPAPPLRPRDPAGHADRHRLRDPQQQRPRALVRRHEARDQRPERRATASPRYSPCPRAGGARSASPRSRRPTSTAGRRTASTSSTPAAGTTSTTSTGSRRTAAARK